MTHLLYLWIPTADPLRTKQQLVDFIPLKQKQEMTFR